MQFFSIVLVLVGAGVAALFILKDNDLLLIGTFIVVVLGFFLAVSRIAKEKS